MYHLSLKPSNSSFILWHLLLALTGLSWVAEGKKRVVVDEECVITVDTADAGQGNITCRIRTPTDTDADIDIVDNNDGTVSIFYTPHTPGNYQLVLIIAESGCIIVILIIPDVFC